MWRLTKPYCFHFPHQCPQMCTAGRSMKLLPGNKLCYRPESLCMHAHSAEFSSFLSIFSIIPKSKVEQDHPDIFIQSCIPYKEGF